MTRYVALLRGINVGGIRIRMADLRELFTELGVTDVRTVLASGNVLFDAAGTVPSRSAVEAALTDRFGYDARVFVVEQSYVSAVVDAYPFADVDGRHSYVVFVSDPQVLADLGGVADELDSDVECVAVGDGVLYWQVEKGKTLQSVVGKRSSTRRSATSTTTRNLRTLRKLL